MGDAGDGVRLEESGLRCTGADGMGCEWTSLGGDSYSLRQTRQEVCAAATKDSQPVSQTCCPWFPAASICASLRPAFQARTIFGSTQPDTFCLARTLPHCTYVRSKVTGGMSGLQERCILLVEEYPLCSGFLFLPSHLLNSKPSMQRPSISCRYSLAASPSIHGHSMTVSVRLGGNPSVRPIPHRLDAHPLVSAQGCLLANWKFDSAASITEYPATSELGKPSQHEALLPVVPRPASSWHSKGLTE
jgi:hypothetical protein